MNWRRIIIFSLVSIFLLYLVTGVTASLMGFTPKDIKEQNLIDSLFIYRIAMFALVLIAWPFVIPKVIGKRFENIRYHLESTPALSETDCKYLQQLDHHKHTMLEHYTNKNMYIKLGLTILFIELVLVRQLSFLGV